MKKLVGFYILVASGFSFSLARAITISAGIPGKNPNSTSSSPGAFVANFYQFALMIGGVLAFGVIIYGGIKYMASAGNPSGQSDAKEWIEAALLGLLLLVGATFILNVVNPQLTSLSLPPLTPVNIQTTQAGAGSSCPSGAQICPGNDVGVKLPPGIKTNCGACGGTCFGSCPNPNTQVCALTTTGGQSSAYCKTFHP